MTFIPPPYVLGLPDRYSDWRPHQMEMTGEIVDCQRRICVPVAPTGSGKSLVYLTAALFLGIRALILTATKALQDQLEHDYSGVAAVVKGKQAYECKMLGGGLSCADGPCQWGMACPYKNRGCGYYLALARARKAGIVITNYHFWCSNNRVPNSSAEDKIGKFQMLVCDEAHQAPGIVGDMFTSEWNQSWPVDADVMRDYPWEGTRFEVGQWLNQVELQAAETHAQMKQAAKSTGRADVAAEAQKWAAMADRAHEAQRTLESELNSMIVEDIRAGKVRIAPLWPYEKGGRLLFQDIPRIIMTSATVREKTLGLLGLSADDYALTEYPHSFPIANRLITWVPTVKVTKNSGEKDLRLWQKTIDNHLRAWVGYKSLTHTVSYDRAKAIMRHSELSGTGYLLSHDARGTARAIEEFKRSRRPRCLVSPAIGTGVDFPGDQARFQIITKVPFPDLGDALLRERAKHDPELPMYMAAVELTQMCGRPVRSEDDWAGTVVVDDTVEWVIRRNKRFFPTWLLQAFRALPRGGILKPEEVKR